MMRVVTKAYAYITFARRLLVFEHVGQPEAGIQVPGGTQEPGESHQETVLREACEETGLEGLTCLAYLGFDQILVDRLKEPYRVERHFFHLAACEPLLETWTHYETSPSDGSPEPLEFQFTWLPLPVDPELLGGNQGACLNRINREYT